MRWPAVEGSVNDFRFLTYASDFLFQYSWGGSGRSGLPKGPLKLAALHLPTEAEIAVELDSVRRKLLMFIFFECL